MSFSLPRPFLRFSKPLHGLISFGGSLGVPSTLTPAQTTCVPHVWSVRYSQPHTKSVDTSLFLYTRMRIGIRNHHPILFILLFKLLPPCLSLSPFPFKKIYLFSLSSCEIHPLLNHLVLAEFIRTGGRPSLPSFLRYFYHPIQCTNPIQQSSIILQTEITSPGVKQLKGIKL